MENKKLYVSVLISVFWILIMMSGAGYCFEQGLYLMSQPNTIFFYLGLLIIAVAILLLVFLIDYEWRKISKVYNDKKKNEQDLKNTQSNERD